MDDRPINYIDKDETVPKCDYTFIVYQPIYLPNVNRIKPFDSIYYGGVAESRGTSRFQ